MHCFTSPNTLNSIYNLGIREQKIVCSNFPTECMCKIIPVDSSFKQIRLKTFCPFFQLLSYCFIWAVYWDCSEIIPAVSGIFASYLFVPKLQKQYRCISVEIMSLTSMFGFFPNTRRTNRIRRMWSSNRKSKQGLIKW